MFTAFSVARSAPAIWQSLVDSRLQHSIMKVPFWLFVTLCLVDQFMKSSQIVQDHSSFKRFFLIVYSALCYEAICN